MRADLIVAGRHGEHRLDERLIGSTTERMVRHAPCSVLVVHPVQREGLTSLKHIVAGTDFSDSSNPAIDAAAALAKSFEAWVTLMHVYDVVPPVPVLEDSAYAGSDFASMCQAALEKLRAARLDGVPSTVQVLRDKSTVTALSEWADDHEVDLMVLGTHGRTGAARLLLGSVAERTVRHAPCAVMVVKPRVAAA
jgi:nucleotide-binding universal stress UspA family protein